MESSKKWCKDLFIYKLFVVVVVIVNQIAHSQWAFNLLNCPHSRGMREKEKVF